MNVFRNLLLILACFALVACSSALQRGMHGSALVSSAQPSFSATSTLPLLATSEMSSFLQAESSFQIVPVWISLYGSKDLQNPFSIISFSEVPNNQWVWDYARTSPPYSSIETKVNFGDQEFYGKTYRLDGTKDAFTLWMTDQETADKTHWLVQRYTALFDFRQNKLIVEYREPLPVSLLEYTKLPESDPMIQAFMQRAKASFDIQFNAQRNYETLIANSQDTIEIDTKYLGKYLGTISPLQLPWSRR